MKNILVFLFIFITSFSSAYSYSTEFHLKNDFGNTGVVYQQALYQFIESHRANQEYLDEVQGRVQNFLGLQEQKNSLLERDKLLVAMFSYLDQLIDYNFYYSISDGFYTEDYGNGRVVYFHVENGKLNGELHMFQNGYLLYTQSYKDNYLHGKEIRYYENSHVIYFTRTYNMGIREGEFTQYHKNSVPALRLNYKDNRFNGIKRSFYENGRLYFSVDYRNGNPNGNLRSYYDNGRLFIEANFHLGLLNGNYTKYGKDRQVLQSMQFSQGSRSGIHRGWNTQGIHVIEVPYNNLGDIHGNVIINFTESGKIMQEHIYENGVNLSSKLYNSDGVITYEGIGLGYSSIKPYIESYLDLSELNSYIIDRDTM